MTASSRRAIRTWMFAMCVLVALTISVGGYVRLVRAGLSIVEWNVVTGVLPPFSEAAWAGTFAKYKTSPEYRQVNVAMTLPEYKRIYWIEYVHRLIARLVGLALVVPMAWFLARGIIPRGRAAPFFGIAALFGVQGFLGWYMVASGLVDQPSVSHYRLTLHLLVALAILALCLWIGMDHAAPPGPTEAADRAGDPGLARWLPSASVALLIAIVLQIAYGGLVAGLKAGHVSNTWPAMFGYVVPPGLLATLQPWWRNLVADPTAVHFAHRWWALAVLALVMTVFAAAWRAGSPPGVRWAAAALLGLVGAQIALGIAVIVWGVPPSVALLHQAMAVAVFAAAVALVHAASRPHPPVNAPPT